MRKYEDGQERKLMHAVCNRCGRSLKVEDGYLREGCISVEEAFGYFSRKDGTVHSFDLCEDCYDEIVAQFKVPVEERKNTEFL